MNKTSNIKNAFTVDLEDWYHAFGLPTSEWDKYEKRVHIGAEKILKLLNEKNTKATFFIIGKVMADFPELVEMVKQEGHEIACHTYNHQFMFNVSPEEFEAEIVACNTLLKENYGLENKGFRAPSFSINQDTWWALDILKKHGYEYDASIYPGDNKRSGIVGFRKDIHTLDNGLIEAPITTFKFLKYQVGFGGAYFRILPYMFYKRNLRKLNEAGLPGIFYVHPWEFDPKHPRVNDLSARLKYPHYFNLPATERRVRQLLDDFEFVPLSQLFK